MFQTVARDVFARCVCNLRGAGGLRRCPADTYGGSTHGQRHCLGHDGCADRNRYPDPKPDADCYPNAQSYFDAQSYLDADANSYDYAHAHAHAHPNSNAKPDAHAERTTGSRPATSDQW
jgi:hypothetical protein